MNKDEIEIVIPKFITHIPKSKNTYTPDSTYTGFDTKDNINSIQSNQTFQADGSIPLRENINFDPIISTSTPNKDVTGEFYDGKVSTLGSGKQIQDFRSNDSVNKFNGGLSNTYSFNYGDPLINKETRVGLGNPGKSTRNRTSYTAQDPDTRDKINYLDVSTRPLNGITENRDLVQLEFQVLTPDQTYYLAFRAFLDTFDDSYNASWNSQRYLGRADNFYTYEGFERIINIGFNRRFSPLVEKLKTLKSGYPFSLFLVTS
jgi:hypothetical protein